MEIATVAAAISAASAAVGLIDKIADEIERFITKKPAPLVPKEHPVKIEKKGDSLVEFAHGKEVRRITPDDLRKLPEDQLQHITVLERSMQNHYRIWSKVYPELALMDSPVQKARVEAQLDEVIRGMRKDLLGILSFIESCGLYLDDHYMNIRELVKQV